MTVVELLDYKIIVCVCVCVCVTWWCVSYIFKKCGNSNSEIAIQQ